MKVLFIILPYITYEKKYAQRSFLTMPYGVLSITTYIKDIADVKIFDCNLYDKYEDVLCKTLKEFNADVYGINLMFDRSYQYLDDIVAMVKHYNYMASIIIGGAAVTYNYEQILKHDPFIDAVCYGEGEEPIRDYLLLCKFNENFATYNNMHPIKSITHDLDKCIDIDYSYIDIEVYQKHIEEAYSPYIHGMDGKRQFIIVSSRGCPYSCTFCMNSLNPDKKVRYASVDSIINHVEKLIELYGMNVLTFYDDQILHDKERALELFTRLKPYNLRIEMPNGVNISALNEDIIRTMKEAGVDSLYLALESGSKKVLKAMKKPVSLTKTKEIIQLLRKYDYYIFCFIVVGMPEETDEDRLETIEYLREIKPDNISPKVASPVYGSLLRKECIEKGYLKDIPFGRFEMTDSLIKTENNKPEDMLKHALYMNYRTNFIENYRMEIGDYITARHYFQHVVNKHPNEIFGHLYLGVSMIHTGEEPEKIIEQWNLMHDLYEKNERNEREKFNYFGLEL